MLTKEIADKIVLETGKKIDYNINIINDKGVIISSKDTSREGHFHEGGAKVVDIGKSLYVSAENVVNLKGTHTGINLPIVLQDKVIGVIGVTGNPEQLKEYKQIVTLTAKSIIHYYFLIKERMWKYNARESLITQILNEALNMKKINHKLSFLNIEISPPYKVVVIKTIKNKNNMNFEEIYNALEMYVFEKNILSGFVDSEHFVIICEDRNQKINNLINEHVICLKSFFELTKIGVSHSVENIYDLNEMYESVKIAIKLSNHEVTYAHNYEAEILTNKTLSKDKNKFKKRILNSLTIEHLNTIKEFLNNDLNV